MKKYLLLITVFYLVSCENNIEVVKNLGELKDAPVVSAQEVEILYSDSAKLKLRITAPEIKRYSQPNKQYTEFPKGIKVEQFDSAMQVVAVIEARYAIYYENKNLWEARNNVVAKNLVKNEELNSEELFWDQAQGIIYSRKFSRISNEDGVFYGEGGFEAKEDLSQWHMLGIKGKVNIKENLDEK
ncbi:MAG: LPS export ABC transporter periplasmic protein LptC [Bacteroidales bacterium]|nr:LPS export ABC transporter periplasmic protein LptC [Bacteroidales bacterium]